MAMDSLDAGDILAATQAPELVRVTEKHAGIKALRAALDTDRDELIERVEDAIYRVSNEADILGTVGPMVRHMMARAALAAIEGEGEK